MMRSALGRRGPFLVLAAICAALLAYAYYLQFAQGLEPCPLCIFQRLAFMAILAIALVAGIHGPGFRGNVLYSALLVLVSTTGAGIAARQTWLQHLPEDQIPECGPGLDFMLDMYPLAETIRRALRGTGDCAKVDWTFLGLSIAGWSLLCFLGIGAYTVFQALRRANRNRGHRRHSGNSSRLA